MGSGRNEGIESEDGGAGRLRATCAGSALLLAALLGASFASEAMALDALPGSEHLQWRGGLAQRRLADGSMLNEYVARTTAKNQIDASLAIGFVPRFGCSPMIGIRLVGPLAGEADASLSDGDRVTLLIDGEAVSMSIVMDTADSVTTLWFDESAATRERFREQLDGASRAELTLAGDNSMLFSMLGSRSSVAGTETACLAHEPSPHTD